MPEVPTEQMTKKQMLRHLMKWSATMSDEFADLRAEVQEDIKDDAARDQRIAELEATNAALADQAQANLDRAGLADAEKAQAQADLDAAKSEARDAVAALRSSDYPNAAEPA